nr:hypothetical protein CFP56_39798 [Quercus suber]
MVVVSGSSRGKPLWKKGPTMEKKQSSAKDAHGLHLGKGAMETSSRSETVSMEAKPSSVIVTNVDNLHGSKLSDIGGNSVDLNNSMGNLVGQPTSIITMQEPLCTEGEVGLSEGQDGVFSFSAKQSPLVDITNRAATESLKSSKQKWSRLLREVGEPNSSSNMEILESRRSEPETLDLTVRKKKRVCVATTQVAQILNPRGIFGEVFGCYEPQTR